MSKEILNQIKAEQDEKDVERYKDELKSQLYFIESEKDSVKDAQRRLKEAKEGVAKLQEKLDKTVTLGYKAWCKKNPKTSGIVSSSGIKWVQTHDGADFHIKGTNDANWICVGHKE